MATVTVACKLPNGVHLDIRGRGRVTLRGTAVAFGVAPVIVPGGYALTPDVDEDWWNAWLDLSRDLDIVKKQIVFAMPKPVEARARAREMAELRTGLEPMDPDKPGPGLQKVGVAG